MTSITDLPLEVLRGIIKNILPSSALCNLALCSRSIYHAVVPFLYEHVELLCFGTDPKNFETDTNKSAFVLRDLTCLFLRRPDLAQHVRRFTLRFDRYTNWVEPDKNFSIDEVDEILKIAIKASSHSEEEEKQWIVDAGWRFNIDAIIALLLPTLVKLLKLDMQVTDNQDYLVRMLKRTWRREKPFDEKPAFQHLTDVVHTYNGENYGLSPNNLSLFTLSRHSCYLRASSGQL
jgi:hypothetical protein